MLWRLRADDAPHGGLCGEGERRACRRHARLSRATRLRAEDVDGLSVADRPGQPARGARTKGAASTMTESAAPHVRRKCWRS